MSVEKADKLIQECWRCWYVNTRSHTHWHASWCFLSWMYTLYAAVPDTLTNTLTFGSFTTRSTRALFLSRRRTHFCQKALSRSQWCSVKYTLVTVVNENQHFRNPDTFQIMLETSNCLNVFLTKWCLFAWLWLLPCFSPDPNCNASGSERFKTLFSRLEREIVF